MAADDAEQDAQDAAGRLANALEEVGFDVGRAFPALDAAVDRSGRPMVSLGSVTTEVVVQLVSVLVRAAQQGVTVSDWSPLWCGGGTTLGTQDGPDEE